MRKRKQSYIYFRLRWLHLIYSAQPSEQLTLTVLLMRYLRQRLADTSALSFGSKRIFHHHILITRHT